MVNHTNSFTKSMKWIILHILMENDEVEWISSKNAWDNENLLNKHSSASALIDKSSIEQFQGLSQWYSSFRELEHDSLVKMLKTMTIVELSVIQHYLWLFLLINQISL